MKEKQFLVFDWDGTLLDSTEPGLLKIEHALSRLNLPCPNREILRKKIGMKPQELFTSLLKEHSLNGSSYEDFCHFYKEIPEEYPDNGEIFETLKRLKKFGFLIGLLTSRSNESWLKSCQVIGFDSSIFDFKQTACHYYHHKPSGRVFGPIINWAKHHGVYAHQILYFGDTINYDYQATLNSGQAIDFIGIVSGVNTYQEFLAAGLAKEQIVSSISNLPLFLNNLIKERVEF